MAIPASTLKPGAWEGPTCAQLQLEGGAIATDTQDEALAVLQGPPSLGIWLQLHANDSLGPPLVQAPCRQ